MVLLSQWCLVRAYSKTFIDKLRVHVSGGTGGNGLKALGGIGGNGGDVFIVGSTNPELSLKAFKSKYPNKRFAADPGEDSTRRSVGALKGASIFIQVPHGVTVTNAKTGDELGEIVSSKSKLRVAKGGTGGSFQSRFIPSKGDSLSISLDLKLIADVGFVGFPNAGKSSLLRRLSKARPKCASYPFTTIEPEIGIAEYPDFRKVKLADLPGLIEGAHLNKGRGHSFLKHIERTNMLLFVIDVSGFQLAVSEPFRNAFDTLNLLYKELYLYDPSLLRKPAVLAINKMDNKNANYLQSELLDMLSLPSERSVRYGLKPDSMPNELFFNHVVPISAKTGHGIEELKIKIRELLDGRSFQQNIMLPENAENTSGLQIDTTNDSNKSLPFIVQ